MCHPDMEYVDVRRLSVEELSRCKNFGLVVRYNDSHKPKSGKKKNDRLYPDSMIDDLINNNTNATQNLLREIENDEDQITLIGQDVVAALLKIARNGHQAPFVDPNAANAAPAANNGSSSSGSS